MYDVVALGELLIDFTPVGDAGDRDSIYQRNPGGAPANVLVTVARMGGSAALIGKVGKDAFGTFLQGVLEKNGVGTQGLRYSEEVPTTLAFVHLDSHGDRSFSFYRHPGADLLLAPEDIDEELLRKTKIFHFGSLSMTDEPARSATKAALKLAKSFGCLISFDPNWRPSLWKNENEAKQAMLYGIRQADIVKLSDTELTFLTGKTDLAEGAADLFRMGVGIIAVTLGAKGCYFMCADGAGLLPTYDTVVVDTTGSGDAFTGALLFGVSRLDGEIRSIKKETLCSLVDFSNAAGALCAAGRGAIPSLPTYAQVKRCMAEASKLLI